MVSARFFHVKLVVSLCNYYLFHWEVLRNYINSLLLIKLLINWYLCNGLVDSYFIQWLAVC